MTRIEDLEISVRTANCLMNEGIRTIEEAASKTDAELLRAPNFGRKSLNELRTIQAALKIGVPPPAPKRSAAQEAARKRCIRAAELKAEGLTLKKIGEQLGVSGPRARQLVMKGQWILTRKKEVQTAAALPPDALAYLARREAELEQRWDKLRAEENHVSTKQHQVRQAMAELEKAQLAFERRKREVLQMVKSRRSAFVKCTAQEIKLIDGRCFGEGDIMRVAPEAAKEIIAKGFGERWAGAAEATPAE